MKKRPLPRRRSRPSLRARVRTYWILAAFVLAGAGWGAWTLANLPAFRLSSLNVTGAAHVSRAEIVARAALDRRANIWLSNPVDIERRIEAIPYVARAYVHRRPPGHVWIDIAERRPDGCVRDVDGYLTIDRERRVLELGCASASLPSYRVQATLDAEPGTYVNDPELLVLERDARALQDAGRRYRAFSHDAFGDLEATLGDGIRVRFGDDGDLERKQRLIGPILAQLGPRASAVRTVDVRAPATPVVEYRAPCDSRPRGGAGACPQARPH